MSDEVCEVVITAPDADWLARFTRTLVEQGLVAAGHVLTPIRSIYRWKGEVFDTLESRVALHTRLSLVTEIDHLTRGSHPFEVPCVVATQIIEGNPEYLQWVLAETVQVNIEKSS